LRRVLDEGPEREALEQRDDVGETLVERGHIRIRVFDIAMVNGVQNRMRHLVRDDVRTEAGEDEPTGIVPAVVLFRGVEITEQQRCLVRVVVRIRIAQRMRIDPQLLDVFAPELNPAPSRPGSREARIPDDLAAESPLEVPNGLHRDGIDELLVKLRVALARRQPLLRGDRLVRQVDRFVPASARRVDIDDLEVFATGARLDLFERHLIEHLVDAGRVEPRREPGIQRVASQVAIYRWLHAPPTVRQYAASR
jgi:hypothetical protein